MKQSDVGKLQKEQGSGSITKDMGTENNDHDPAFKVNF